MSQNRLQQQIDELQQQWDLLSQKLTHLEKSRIIGAQADEQFRLNYLIAELKAERQQIGRQLAKAERQLAAANRAVVTVVSEPSQSSDVLASSDNPFGDKGRIQDAARFFDRDDLLRQIFEELAKGVNISLVGESAVGKSSILTRLCQQGNLPDTTFIYFNLEWIDNEEEFYDALCEKLGVETCRGYKFTRALREKRFVICLDEIEKMAWEGFSAKVRSHLRGLADGADAPLKLVIVSRSPVAHLFPDSPELNSPLAGICRQIDVKPFQPEIARQCILQRLQNTGIQFTTAQISAMIRVTGGHPAKLQDEAAKLYRALIERG